MMESHKVEERKTQMQNRTARKLEAFGQTIFTEMSLLAARHKAVNLGQGFPNFDGPEFVKQAAMSAIEKGHGQYARMFGIPELNAAIADRFEKDSGLKIDADKHITVTSGCTEAIASSLIGLLNEGDEVLVFEPFYDSYRAALVMAGAVPKFVTLRPPDFAITKEQLEQAFTDKTKGVLVNTPHNPTGRVFTRAELELISEFAKRNDAIVFADEVYDKLVFEGEHVSIATLPGMWERTVTMNSLGKTFSLTGWKI
ncbi:MAG TPA: aminotransferase class I/II-fold pyridoxal phosphate-dependent enzyme, partial [Phycisphaerales bacterium]|nr:aminotransferase class I/II-fold pyridoxal phosphate-dependent enzyme [Phycisphaerales bacterium]